MTERTESSYKPFSTLFGMDIQTYSFNPIRRQINSLEHMLIEYASEKFDRKNKNKENAMKKEVPKKAETKKENIERLYLIAFDTLDGMGHGNKIREHFFTVNILKAKQAFDKPEIYDVYEIDPKFLKKIKTFDIAFRTET